MNKLKIRNNEKKIMLNTVMLYLMTFVKMVFPLLTLPYLTRVLSMDGYAVVSYVKASMVYMQIFIDFGFIMSATKDIVKAKENYDEIGKITGVTLMAKGILALIGFAVVGFACIAIPILSENVLYTILAYTSIALTVFLPDFLFQGIEKMQAITIRFIIMRGLSTLLTFVCVKNDSHLLLIPIWDIIGTLVAILWTWVEIRKMGICVVKSSIKEALSSLSASFIYFISDAATTVFGAFNTLLIGIVLSNKDIAFWSVAMQLISAAQALYSPITSGIYPNMVRERNFGLVRKILYIFMPLILLAVSGCFIFGEWIIVLISGAKYREAVGIFRCLLPLLIMSFPVMLLGWPCLGAIDKQKQVTFSTISAAVLQILTLVILLLTNHLTLITIALARCLSELLLLGIRAYYCVKFRKKFVYRK